MKRKMLDFLERPLSLVIIGFLYLIAIIIIGMTFGCNLPPDAECKYLTDCPANETCEHGMCEQFFPPAPGPLIKYSVTAICDCWKDPALHLGWTRANEWCVSGFEEAMECLACCDEECLTPQLGLFCN